MSEAGGSGQATSKDQRGCGPCSLCCTVLRVDELKKLGGIACDKLGPDGTGCSIHETRPSICRRYRCLWLQGKLEEQDRPDQLGAILDLVSEGTLPRLTIREARPGAHDESPRLQSIAARFRQSMHVQITDTSDVLDADTPYRVLLPNGEDHTVVGDRTIIRHSDGRTEEKRLPWMERQLRHAILSVRRFRLRSWRR